MAFTTKVWYDAPNPLTPLSAAAMNDLETRIAAAATQADAFNLQPAVRVTNSAAQSITSGTITALTFNTNRFDSDSQHFTSGSNLTGTVAKTNGSAAVVGTGTLFTTQLSVGQIIDVPGTAVETRVVTSITDDTHLTVAGNFANTASGQTATRNNKGIVARTAGVYDIQGSVEWVNNTTGLRHLLISRAGVTGTSATLAYVLDDAVNSGTNPFRMTISTQAKLAQWEIVQLVVIQSSGAGLNVNAAAEYSPEFSAVRQAAG